jgi:RHS repeat-associated protein
VGGSAYSQAGQLLISGHSQHGTNWYIYLGGKQIAEHHNQGGNLEIKYIHTDALGSPVARTDANRTESHRTRYEPYGATHSGGVPAGLELGFTGHVNDGDTGLVYMQQRYYEPLAGRFLSVDPVVTNANTGAMFNRYDYAMNNPYKYVDPDGRAPAYHGMSLSGFSSGGGGWSGSRESGGGPGLTGSSGGYLIAPGTETSLNATGALAGTLTPEQAREFWEDAGEAVATLASLTPMGRGVKLGMTAAKAPSLSAHKAALRSVHEKVGKLPKGQAGKYGSPQAGTSQKGYRLDPPHDRAASGSAETNYHFNWWDYSTGKRGSGGRSGAIPIGD